MNWGKSIVVSFVVFAIFIMYFVVRMLLHEDSVPNNYYEKGNKYQEVLNAKKDAGEYKPRVEFDKSVQGFIIAFDSILPAGPDSIHVRFEWPPDAGRNLEAAFGHKKRQAQYIIPCRGPVGGWNVDMEFYINSRRYILQKKVWVE